MATEAGTVEDVVEAVAQLGRRPLRVIRLSPRTGAMERRASFRVETETGAVIKARRMESEAVAREQMELRSGLPDAFPPVLARFGPILIETWIEGRPLGEMPPPAPLIRQAGALLATLHARECAGGRPLPFRAGMGGLRDETLSRLRWLAECGALDAASADRLATLAAGAAPEEAPHCLIHTDYCGENLVVDLAGRLFVVDNEHFRFGPAAMDLARSWYRWGWGARGAPAWQWTQFREAYEAAGGERAEPARDPFWRIAAVVVSAFVRLRTGHPEVSTPLLCLGDMARAGTVEGNLGA